MKDEVLFNYSRKRSCIENEEDRSKDWFPWNSERDGNRDRFLNKPSCA